MSNLTEKSITGKTARERHIHRIDLDRVNINLQQRSGRMASQFCLLHLRHPRSAQYLILEVING
jgi:hypothetical protein